MRKLLYFLVLIVIFSCEPVQPDEFYQYPTKIEDYPADPLNPLNSRLVESGDFFFHSKLLSPSGMVACSSCHTKFGDSPDITVPGGAGLGWIFNEKTQRYEKNLNYEGKDDLMWDVVAVAQVGSAYQKSGGASQRFGFSLASPQLQQDIRAHFGLDTFPACDQLLHQANMALGGHRQIWKPRIMESPLAMAKLEHSFPNINWETESEDSLKFKVGKTLDAFQRVSGMEPVKASKFAKAMIGEYNMTIPQRKGLELFKLHCTSCHENPVMGSNTAVKSFMSDNGGPNPNHLAQISGDVPDTLYYYRMARPLVGRINNIKLFGYDGRYDSKESYMDDKYPWLELEGLNGGMFGHTFTEQEKFEIAEFLDIL